MNANVSTPVRAQRRLRFGLKGAVVALALAAAPAAKAMVINLNFDSSITSMAQASQIETAFRQVATDYSKSFSNSATVNVTVSWGSVDGKAIPSGDISSSMDNLYGYFTYAQMKSFLVAGSASNPANAALAQAVKTLPATAPSGPTNYVLPSSEAKALGLISPTQSATDGYIGFSGAASTWDFNPANGITAGTYDFEAAAAHELDEVLGRISGLQSLTASYRTPFDLFRYSAAGKISFAYNSAAYFSGDGGVTSLGAFNYGANSGDRGDWLTTAGSTDIQNAFLSKGQDLSLSAADLTALDLLGWGALNPGTGVLATPTGKSFNFMGANVPEPSTWALMIVGLFGTGLLVRRRHAHVHA